MLHAKFQDYRTSGSGEQDFWRLLTYMEVVAILVMWPWQFYKIYLPSSHEGSE